MDTDALAAPASSHITQIPIPGVKMTKIKSLIRDYDKEKDPFKKLVLVGAILDELEIIKKELTRKLT